MILITGAAGKTGLAVIRQIVARGGKVRAFVYHPDQMAQARSAGAANVVAGDLLSESEVDAAMQDVAVIYHICPNVHPAELEIGRVVLKSAMRHGVADFVYHSVLHPQVQQMPHHWLKMRVEEAILESGLNFTILQAAAYMQNLLGSWDTIIKEGYFEMPYPIGTRLSLVDLEDVAGAAATVLTEPGHRGAIYELSGPQPLDQQEIAHILGKVLRKPVVFSELSHDLWRARAEKAGLSEYRIRTLLAMFNHYAEFDFCGNPNVLNFLIGRKPATLEEFVRRLADSKEKRQKQSGEAQPTTRSVKEGPS